MDKGKELTIYTDGGARGNPGPAASAFVVKEGDSIIHEQAFYLGERTNNYAEYKGVDFAMDWLADYCKENKVKQVTFILDSQLVVNQLSGNYKVKSKNLIELFLAIKNKEKSLSCRLVYTSVLRDKNKRADKLLNDKLDQVQNKIE